MTGDSICHWGICDSGAVPPSCPRWDGECGGALRNALRRMHHWQNAAVPQQRQPWCAKGQGGGGGVPSFLSFLQPDEKGPGALSVIQKKAPQHTGHFRCEESFLHRMPHELAQLVFSRETHDRDRVACHPRPHDGGHSVNRGPSPRLNTHGCIGVHPLLRLGKAPNGTRGSIPHPTRHCCPGTEVW